MRKKSFLSLLLAAAMIFSFIVPVNAASKPILKVTSKTTEIDKGEGTANVVYTITLDPNGNKVAAFSFTLNAPEGMTLSDKKLGKSNSNEGGEGYWLAVNAMKKDEDDDGNPIGYFEPFEYNSAAGKFGASGGVEGRTLDVAGTVMTIMATIDISKAATYTLGVDGFICYGVGTVEQGGTTEVDEIKVIAPHEHVYDQTVVAEKYLKTKADCENASVYYKSCVCGEKGGESDNFISGDPLGHAYTEKIEDTAHLKSEASKCTEYDTYWYDCSRCTANAKNDGAAEDKWYTSTTAGAHSFTQMIEDADHLKIAGDCQNGNTYIYDCEYCDTKGGETDTYVGVTKGDHKMSTKWTVDDENDKHYHKCTVNGCTYTEDTEACSGTGATCEDFATCTECGQSFGTTVDHKYIEKVDNQYVVEAAACGKPATYKKSCEWCGEKSETETFTYGEVGQHIYTGEVVKDEALASPANCTEAAKYWKSCSCGEVGVNGETFTVGAPLGHTGGTATCTAQAICTRCTQSYGDKLAHSMTHYEAVPADCKAETNGSVEYWACSTCTKNYTDELGTTVVENTVVAWAHVWDAGVVTTEPTKEAEGVMTYTCTVEGCGATKTDPIAKLPSAVITPVGPSKDKEEETGEVELTMNFADVTTADWFYDTVKYTYENGLMNGTSDEAFAPYANTSRAMLVTILWRLEGEPAPLGDCQFVDVPANTWYTKAVTWAAEKGIVTGLTATEFGADADITREQFATILWRYAKNYKGYDVSVGEDTNILSYTDAMVVSEYAIPAMQWACGAGLINGIDGALQPAGYANRAQAATILARFCQIYQ